MGAGLNNPSHPDLYSLQALNFVTWNESTRIQILKDLFIWTSSHICLHVHYIHSKLKFSAYVGLSCGVWESHCDNVISIRLKCHTDRAQSDWLSCLHEDFSVWLSLLSNFKQIIWVHLNVAIEELTMNVNEAYLY